MTGGVAMAAVRKMHEGPRIVPLRSWFMFLAGLLLTGGSALAVVGSAYESRQLLNELQRLETRRNALQVEWGRLLLEQSSLVAQGRVEDIAVAELGMKVPAIQNIVVITRD